ncbi:MAG: DMT family transporter [Acidimicrobiales bacterium]
MDEPGNVQASEKGTIVLVVVLALGAAVFNALSSVLQRSAARDAPDEDSLRLKLVTYLLHRPAWLAGFVSMGFAFVCQAAALTKGTLSIVQPILVMELLFVLAILALWFHVPVGRLEWAGAVATVVGLGGFLAVAKPSGGTATPSWVALGATGIGVVVVVAMAIALSRGGSSASRAALFGVAAGATFGLTAGIIKLFTDAIAAHGLGAALLRWPPYALIVTGVAALFFAQNAFQAGPLTASQPALTITDPMVSVAIGVSLFGDHLAHSGADIALEVVAFVVMALGVVALSLSPHITGDVRSRRDKGTVPSRTNRVDSV